MTRHAPTRLGQDAQKTACWMWPEMARPCKQEGEKVLRTHISFRPDQAEKVRLLAVQKRLSAVCQAAIDAA